MTTCWTRRSGWIFPSSADSVTVQRRQAHILIDANYTEQVEILPRYFYPWQAKMHVDVLTLVFSQEAEISASTT